VLGACVLGATYLNEKELRAFTFVTLVMGNLALIFSNRSRTASFWTLLRTPNRALWWVASVTLGLLSLTLYWPWMARLFNFEHLPLSSLLVATGLGLSSVLWFELIKFSRRRPQ
jgi:Ca2+-transporting ATPase